MPNLQPDPTDPKNNTASVKYSPQGPRITSPNQLSKQNSNSSCNKEHGKTKEEIIALAVLWLALITHIGKEG